MKIGKTLYVIDRRRLRAWLKEHHATEKGIWLVFPNKDSGRPRLPYNDAVEEALCFGWIDSTVKKFGPRASAQRFSPRNPKSTYSQPNRERLKALVRRGRVIPEVLAAVRGVLTEKFVFPRDILARVRADREAWKNYRKFPESYRRVRVAFLDASRGRPEEFKKRLAYFLKRTRQNKRFGYGGIEKYYKPGQ